MQFVHNEITKYGNNGLKHYFICDSIMRIIACILEKLSSAQCFHRRMVY